MNCIFILSLISFKNIDTFVCKSLEMPLNGSSNNIVLRVRGLFKDHRAIRKAKEMINVKVIGMLILSDDISPSLAMETIQSITVRGVIKAPDDVKEALSGRFH